MQKAIQYVCITNQAIDSNYTRVALIVKLIMSGPRHHYSTVTFTQGNTDDLLFVCLFAFWVWSRSTTNTGHLWMTRTHRAGYSFLCSSLHWGELQPSNMLRYQQCTNTLLYIFSQDNVVSLIMGVYYLLYFNNCNKSYTTRQRG